jgi:hypothetical protein
LKAYKGFNKDMTCRGFQYEEGKSYETDRASLCNEGFHACEAPLDCFYYYPPADSVYHEVELEELTEETSDDSKRVGKRIRVGAKLDVAGLVKAQFEYDKEHTTEEHTDPKAATAGDYGAATAGDCGAATAGYRGAATAGNRGAATSRGASKTGKNGLSVARGNHVRAMGGLGAVLVLCEEEANTFDIKEWKAAVVDGETIKPDTWYELRDGEFKEVTDDEE